MNNENYIVINSKKTELTGDQLEALGIEVEKKRNNPFNSDVYIHDFYHYIDTINGVLHTCFDDREIDKTFINDANSFNDKDSANASRGFYHSIEKYSKLQMSTNKLTIDTKDIIINDDKISITIDEDNIDKFGAIEINGIKFVRENS